MSGLTNQLTEGGSPPPPELPGFTGPPFAEAALDFWYGMLAL
jgi:hypothetical protein